MALKTNYKDDVFTGNRKYKQTSNSDGSISLEDTTEYTQEGDIFAAKDINDTNTAVNANAKAIADLTPKVNTNASSIDTLNISKQDKAIKATITLATAWTDLTQSISVPGITPQQNAILDVVTSTSEYEAQESEWSKIYKAETYEGGIKFYAKEATTVDLTVQVLAMWGE